MNFRVTDTLVEQVKLGQYPFSTAFKIGSLSVPFFCLTLIAMGLTSLSLAQENQEGKVSPKQLRALIVDGQNNHGIWPKTTDMMKAMLEETGRFKVSIARTAPKGEDPDFKPVFSDYDVVISNYNGNDWPEETRNTFESFVSDGGGFVVVHAADNAFPNWPAYNRMIGLGGWGNRTEASGPWFYYDHGGKPVRDNAPGRGGSHGNQHEFVVETRAADHPIMKGFPQRWLHKQDELYDTLRGPAEEIEILATAMADPNQGGSGRHEPMVMTIRFGKGRVFHTTLGHADYSMECAGFVTLFQRGTEWAATGEVTLPVPAKLPSENATANWEPTQMLKKIELGKTVNPFAFGNILLAGQPDQDDLELLKARGVKRIVTLRQLSEETWDQAAWAKEGGMEFERFPVAGAGEMTDDWFDSIRKQLSSANEENGVLLHCRSGGRVGAAWAAWRALDGGISIEQAMEEAATVGLKKEDMVERARKYIETKKSK